VDEAGYNTMVIIIIEMDKNSIKMRN